MPAVPVVVSGEAATSVVDGFGTAPVALGASVDVTVAESSSPQAARATARKAGDDQGTHGG